MRRTTRGVWLSGQTFTYRDSFWQIGISPDPSAVPAVICRIALVHPAAFTI
jgi:hypothetical protein